MTTSSNPLDHDENVAIGITLPIRRGKVGYFESSYQTIDQLKSNIKNLFMTKKGERLFQPNLGSDLWKTVFEQNDDDIDILFDDIIRETLKKWLPFVIVTQLYLNRDSTNIDMYKVEVDLKFTIANDPTTLHSVTFVVE